MFFRFFFFFFFVVVVVVVVFQNKCGLLVNINSRYDEIYHLN